jgi:hypothetical protein
MRASLRVRAVVVAAALAAAGLVVGQGSAIASAASTCTGTSTNPGTLAGNYPGNVEIVGTCNIDAGPANVAGNLVVSPGASLVGIFGMNDETDSGNSNLTVQGNLDVDQGASVMIGCYPLMVTLWGETGLNTGPEFPCTDDPNQNNPTLSATETIDGSIIATDPLGVVVHNATVGGNVEQFGGGAGLGCAPVGIFNQYFGFPDYTFYANVTVDGNLSMTSMKTCWWGAIRDTVRGSMTANYNLTTTDGAELVTNVVYGNLTCDGNNLAVEYGDSNGSPNEVAGNAYGQCAFGLILPNPVIEPGVPPNATVVPTPISVKLGSND